MLSYLKEFPQARERRNKTRSIGNLMRKTHPVLQGISAELMEQIVDEIEDYSRYWRKILGYDETLRGKDYDTKKVVVQEKQIELGVAEMGFDEKLPW